jgi:UDP-N-acetylglucosamine transferase subunit ALG13
MTTLLVANDGGHAAQLAALAPRCDLAGDDELWVTVETPQTASLLRGKDVLWVEPAVTRDAPAALRNALRVRDVFRQARVQRAISTGSSLAVSVLPQAWLHGAETHYIESVTRTDGPSLSGRMLARIPGIHVYTQWPSWASARWGFGGSVLDGYTAVPLAVPATGPPVGRIVVSLGTSARYGYRRLVERLASIVPPTVEVLWQTGCTDVTGLGIDARPSVPAAELHAAMADANVVVAHAGAGLSLTALDLGRIPVLAPRRAELGEHVDDHQWQIATALHERGLAVVRDASSLTWADIVSAAAVRAVRAEGEAHAFRLAPPRRVKGAGRPRGPANVHRHPRRRRGAGSGRPPR